MGKICFPLGKIELWTHSKFCPYDRIFGIRKGREYLYQLFDVLPKQTTCEVKAIQVYMFTFSSDFMMFKISCLSFRWRFFPYQLSHRYVMKMCCQPITILGYTSQSRKFEKFINIHLNKKNLRRSSITHFQKQPPEVFCKSCSWKFGNIHHKKTPVMESLSNKVAELKACNVIKKKLQHRYFPVNIARSLRTLFWRLSASDCFSGFEVFYLRNLLILAMRMLHLAYEKKI